MRIAVTIEEPTTPFPITIYFVHVIDTDVDAWAVIPVGVELGQRFDRRDVGEPKGREPIDRLPRPLNREAVQDVTARLAEYIEFARGCIAVGRTPSAVSETPGSRPRRRRRREQSPEFLQGIAEQFLTWSDGGRAVTEIAEAHGVNRSTASRWVQAARDGGYLPQLETEHLGHSGRGRKSARNRAAVQRTARR